MCHYSATGDPNPATADWRPSFNETYPSVVAGSLWASICQGKGKHCSVKGGEDNIGTVDEGTPQIVRKDPRTGHFYVTFHGWVSIDCVSLEFFINRNVELTPDFWIFIFKILEMNLIK